MLFSTTCYKLGYRPAIFNVYNKIIVECYSINEKGNKQVTTKDLFVAYLLNQLGGNQGEDAYRKAL
jgi:pterin-4a-carbinolamine dehydratase